MANGTELALGRGMVELSKDLKCEDELACKAACGPKADDSQCDLEVGNCLCLIETVSGDHSIVTTFTFIAANHSSPLVLLFYY